MARCLLDTGCTKSMILKKFTDKKRQTKLSDKDSIKYLTYGSSFKSSMTASVGFKMVEFESQKNNTIEYEFQVGETSDPNKQLYDVIIGNDLLYNMGVNIMFKEKQIQRSDDKVPLKEMGSVYDREFCDMLHSMYTDSPLLQEAEERQDRVMDCNYSKVDIDALVADVDTDESSKEQLGKTLRKFENGLFGGGLGKLKNCKPTHIKLQPGAKPFKGRYYNLPKAYEHTCKKEIQRMVDIGVLKELPWYDGSPWASPTFEIPKNTGDIRIITDFRELNKWVEVDQFSLPKIKETLQKLEKFKSATALNLSLGFYSIPLDEASQTILPWDKYSYLRMPMGVSCLPSMFQSIMTDTLRGLDVLVYCDDILVIQQTSQSTKDHLIQVERVLERLQSAGFKANLRNSFFMQKSVEYLGYQLATDSIGPQPKKIEAMERVLAPQNSEQLKRFLGMISFYRNVFKRRSHILAPLNDLSAAAAKPKKGETKKKIAFKMLKVHLDAFN